MAILYFLKFRQEDRVMADEVVFNACQGLHITLRYPTDWIDIVKVEKTDTEGLANVLEDLDGVRRRLISPDIALPRHTVVVVFGVRVAYRRLILDLSSLLVKFSSEVVDSATACVIALKSVTVGQPCKLHDANTATPLARQSIFFVLHDHVLVAEVALEEIKVEAVHRNELG